MMYRVGDYVGDISCWGFVLVWYRSSNICGGSYFQDLSIKRNRSLPPLSERGQSFVELRKNLCPPPAGTPPPISIPYNYNSWVPPGAQLHPSRRLADQSHSDKQGVGVEEEEDGLSVQYSSNREHQRMMMVVAQRHVCNCASAPSSL